MFYSKTTKGFYDAAIHGDNIPPDAVDITPEEHAALLEGQAAGLLITDGVGGKPVLQAAPAKTPAELAAEESAQAKRELAAIDLASIPLLRTYIAAKADAPQELKDLGAAAALKKAKIK